MKKLTDKDIKEISEMIDSGFTCYVNLETFEYVLILESYDRFADEEDPWVEERRKVDEEWERFERIEKMPGYESFKIMEKFADMIPVNDKLKARLYNALSNKRPFAHFKNLIDYSDYREAWFAFKTQCVLEYVKEQLEGIESQS